MTELAHRISTNTVWVFVFLVALLATWETVAPGRQLRISTPRRWLFHFLLYAASVLTFRLIFGIGTVALAAARASYPYGLLNGPGTPWVVKFAGFFLVLDLQRYLLHR